MIAKTDFCGNDSRLKDVNFPYVGAECQVQACSRGARMSALYFGTWRKLRGRCTGRVAELANPPSGCWIDGGARTADAATGTGPSAISARECVMQRDGGA